MLKLITMLTSSENHMPKHILVIYSLELLAIVLMYMDDINCFH